MVGHGTSNTGRGTHPLSGRQNAMSGCPMVGVGEVVHGFANGSAHVAGFLLIAVSC